MSKGAGKWNDKRAMNNVWKTPPEVLDPIRRYAPIGIDPCTEPDNPSQATTFFTEADNGLLRPWDGHGLVFVNPPYSLTEEAKQQGEKTPPIRLWAEKIHTEARRGVVVIALLPCGARFSTGYFSEHILSPRELKAVCFVKGRVKFIHGVTGKPGKGNNYDSAIYGFNVEQERFVGALSSLGTCWRINNRPSMLEGFV